MDSSARSGEIFVIEEVVRELERKDDEVLKWVKEHHSMVVPVDTTVLSHLATLMAKHGSLVDPRRNKSVCDPWVIALAMARGLTVVTAEKTSGNLKKPKIPDVCKDLHVPCLEVVEFFRMQGWRI